MSIYVSIAAYQEPLLTQTLNSLVTTAAHPEDLTISVIDQISQDRAAVLIEQSASATLKYQRVDPILSQGVCWARSLAQQQYTNQDFYLQIDSHMVFDQHWDIALIQQLRELLTVSKKPILTAYPPPFTQTSEGPVKQAAYTHTLITVVNRESTLTEDNPELVFHSACDEYTTSVPGYQISGGFLFTLGKFVTEIAYDPVIYFVGEEQTLSVRAWTKGWDIWHPNTVPVYHLYKSPGLNPESVHWHETLDSQRPQRYWHRQAQSKQRMRELLYFDCELGIYGLGSQRTLVEFAEYSGIDYPARTVHDKARGVDHTRWQIVPIRD